MGPEALGGTPLDFLEVLTWEGGLRLCRAHSRPRSLLETVSCLGSCSPALHPKSYTATWGPGTLALV